jgi:hypothetical protein
MNNIWYCKIGDADNLPDGADWPMRQAIHKAYLELTGEEPRFLFSGWGASLTKEEKQVAERQANENPKANEQNPT